MLDIVLCFTDKAKHQGHLEVLRCEYPMLCKVQGEAKNLEYVNKVALNTFLLIVQSIMLFILDADELVGIKHHRKYIDEKEQDDLHYHEQLHIQNPSLKHKEKSNEGDDD